jgi:gliding motility-associated-like protein
MSNSTHKTFTHKGSHVLSMLFFALTFLWFAHADAQSGRFNNWYFGNTAGVTFASGTPVALTNGALVTTEGCASMSDELGNLLFYSDGVTVWNANHLPMTNGTLLNGHASSTQSGIIVQRPNSATNYYIFTADADVGPDGIQYSEINMSLSAGLGAVTANKNIPLQTPSCEKLTAVRHCNNRDIWIVSHDWNSNQFRTWLITPAGVNLTPVLSSAGAVVTGINQSSYGQLKSNPDGNKLLASYYGFSTGGTNRMELYDFNNQTGVVSNAVTLATDIGLYGAEFSPNGRVVYGSTNGGTLIQYNICAANAAAITASRYVVGSLGPFIGSLQLGPDNKVYVARNTTSLSVINNPNTLGVGCGFVNAAIPLAGRISRMGLPNMASFYVRPQIQPFNFTANCLNVGFVSPSVTVSSSSCAGAANAIQSVLWNFGDPASGALNTSTTLNPSHNFSAVGSYTVTLILNLGCYNDTITRTINLSGFNVTTSATNASCGASNGTATVTPALAGVYTYLWSNGQTTQTATGLAAGSYSVTVNSSTGCSTVATATVLSGGSISLNVNPVSATCNGSATGSATALGSGGTAPYTYSWSTGATGASVNSLAAGAYTATVTDAGGCSATQSFTITQPTVLAATVTTSPVTCAGGTGSASIVASGGTSPYTYNWSSGGSGTSVTGLANGSYTVTVTDNRGCTTTRNFTINQPAALSATLNLTQIPCNGAANGQANLTLTGGTAPYNYLWSNGSTATSLSALSPGAIGVTITDASGCTVTRNGTITQPTSLVSTVAVVQPGCTSPQGTASATVSGGTAPYTYAWSSGSVTNSAVGLAVGNYTLLVTDNNGCTDNDNFSINAASALSVSLNATNVNCFGAANGSIISTVVGGVAPISYTWSNGGSANQISSLIPGTYTLTATDASGCSASATASITQPAGMNLTASVTEATCGSPNGSISVIVSGGTGPYAYSWNTTPVQTTTVASNLAAGVYTLTVTDATGCSTTSTSTVNNTGTLSLSATVTSNVSCFGGNDGAAVASANGGTTPYTYFWTSGGSGTTSTGISAGNFSVMVVDGAGCNAVQAFSITQPTVINATVSTAGVSCFGGNNGSASVTSTGGAGSFTYSWSNGATGATAANLVAGNYTVVISDLNNCSINRIASITQPTEIVINPSVTQITCAGVNNGSITLAVNGGQAPYSSTWSNGATGLSLTNLSAGAYSYTLLDASGCSKSGTLSITAPSVLQAAAIASPVSCFNSSDGSIDLTITGGSSPYSVVWSNAATTEDLSSASAGNYVANITDNSGCVVSASAVVTEPDSISFTWAVTPSACSASTGTLLFSASGGQTPYQFSLDGSLFQNSPFFGSLTAGMHELVIRDANSCELTRFVSVPSPATISASIINVNHVSCFGGSDGEAQVQVTGGTAPFQISWSSEEASYTATMLSAGSQYVTISDAAGCTITETITITQPAQIALVPVVTNVDCYGASSGSISLSLSGGTGALQLLWETGATGNILSNIPTGEYTVDVTDANGCLFSDTFNVAQPQQPILLQTTVTAGDCGNSGGTITVISTGGTAPYTYDWTEVPGVNNPIIGNLNPGTYNLTITDAQGCIETTSATLQDFPPVLAVVDSVVDASCNGAGNGRVYLSVSGGTAPYSYQWGQGLQSALPDSMPSGTYTMQVLDLNGCSANVNFTINQPLALLATATAEDLTCNGSNDGRVLLSVNGGSQPYSFNWSNGPQSVANNNLPAGNYSCTITDVNGCSITVSDVVMEPSPIELILEIDQPGCNGNNNGAITAIVSGGTGLYSYQWSNGSIAPGIAGLAAGSYTVNVIDENGCTKQSVANLSSDPAFDIYIEGDTVLCIGEQTILQASAVGLHNQYSFVWDHGVSGQAIAANPQATTFYTVTVTDSTGCSGSKSILVEVSSIPSLAIVAADSAGCAPFCVKLSAISNASSFVWSLTNGQTYTDQEIQPCFDLPGIYGIQLSASDSNGCSTSMTWSETIEVFPTPIAGFAANPLEASLDNPVITFQNQSIGASSYSYHFGDPAQSYVMSPDAAFSYQDTGYFEVTLQVTSADGCYDEAVQTIHIGGFTAFYIPRAFTPNADGLNDMFLPKATGLSPEGFEMRIYNRWGELIFSSNDWDKGWDGTINGKPVPLDQYVCKVRYFDKTGNQNDHIGSVIVTE